MKPALDRIDQVVAHVVAWHNRHPLAQRIGPDQVHSVGVVSLPFAVRGARVDAPPAPAPTGPALHPTEATPEAPVPDETEVAVEAEVELETDASAPLAPTEPPVAPAAPSILDRALDSAPPSAEPAGAADAPAAPTVLTGLTHLPTRPPAWHPRTWWQALRRTGPFHALFSEDFIAPLRPHQVARWVAAHGVGARPLEPSAPQRTIVLDATRRRAGDTATDVELHVITAAIGLDDDRHRLLLSPDGHLIGPRHWSRPRVSAAAAASLALLAIGLTGAWWRPGASGPSVAAPVLAAASAASASAPAPAEVRAVAASAAPAPAAVPAPAPATAQASAPEAVALAAPASAVSAAVHPDPVAQAAPAPLASAPAAVAAAPSAPISVEPRRGRIDLPPLVPRLAAVDRHDLRSGSRALRREPAVLPDARAWALVTPTLTDRRQSERVAAQLQAVALLQPLPMRAELMATGRGWRAVFWPFPTETDAEKVRLALADKGLRTEVLEF